MARRKPMTASEHMEELSRDPEYLARVAERDRKIAEGAAEYAQEDDLIAREAKELGYQINSVWDFVNNSPHPFLLRPFVGPYERAYPLLVRHLSVSHHPKVREGIIRALTVKDGGPEVSAALFREFSSEQNPELKWVLANALKAAMPLRERRKYPEIAACYKGTL